jgi:hypothetical protein
MNRTITMEALQSQEHA